MKFSIKDFFIFCAVNVNDLANIDKGREKKICCSQVTQYMLRKLKFRLPCLNKTKMNLV